MGCEKRSEIATAYIPGQFTYFLVTGTLSLLGGFSTEFVSKAYNITKDEAYKITKSQIVVLIIKLGEDEKTKMPKTSENSTHKLVHKITSSTTFTEKEFPFLKEVGLPECRPL
ncbi:hypothetical protein CerSpe_060950 [Prunus speciosa]